MRAAVVFLNLIKKYTDKKELMLKLAVIWLSLTTYAWEDYDSVCGAFYVGSLYLQEAMSDLFEEEN